MTSILNLKRGIGLSCTCGALAGVLFTPIKSAGQEYEYEPDEGLHQEEWYDPSDWFDDTPGIDYEEDWWDYPDYPYDYTLYFDAHDYDYGLIEPWGIPQQTYGLHYDWDPVHNEWRSDYGPHTQMYQFDAVGDYGWHYDWNPRSEQWAADYGWHSSNWDFDYGAQEGNMEDERQRRQALTIAEREMQGQREQARQAAGQTENIHIFRGEVQALRRVQPPGEQGRETMAGIRLDSGRRIAVNLGSRTPESLGIEVGDEVTVRGRAVDMGGREILMVQSARISGQRFTSADEDQAGRQQSAAQGRSPQTEQGQGQMVEVSGRLEELSRANIEGIPESHTLARVTLRNGREITVDLGPNFVQEYGRDRVRRLLQRADDGDRIRIRGEHRTVNGREILRARQFRLEGRQVLDRNG